MSEVPLYGSEKSPPHPPLRTPGDEIPYKVAPVIHGDTTPRRMTGVTLHMGLYPQSIPHFAGSLNSIFSNTVSNPSSL